VAPSIKFMMQRWAIWYK